MKQLELEYPAYNYTETSKSAWINKKDKLTNDPRPVYISSNY